MPIADTIAGSPAEKLPSRERDKLPLVALSTPLPQAWPLGWYFDGKSMSADVLAHGPADIAADVTAHDTAHHDPLRPAPDTPPRPASYAADAAPSADPAVHGPLPAAALERAIQSGASSAQAAGPLSDGRPQPAIHKASLLRHVLGSFWDAVHEGINAAGRACKHAIVAAHSALASLVDRRADVPSGQSTHTGGLGMDGMKTHAAPQSAMQQVAAANLASLNSVLAATSVLDHFERTDITYQNLLYLIEPRAFRESADANGTGLGAPSATESSSLMRRLVTGAQCAENPYRHPLGNQGAAQREFDMAAADYIARRDAAYPDFNEIFARLRDFGDAKIMQQLKDRVEDRRADRVAQGATPDEDAYILETPLLPDGKPVITARQLRADILRMRLCLADMAAYLQARVQA